MQSLHTTYSSVALFYKVLGRTARLFLIGIAIGIGQVIWWSSLGFGPLAATDVVRVAIPSALGIMLGFQTILMSFFSGVLTTPRRSMPDDAVIES